jgi:hypothetical protein
MMTSLSRRNVLACGLAIATRTAWAATREPDRIAFDVTRNGRAIGTHTLTFIRAGQDLRVLIEASFRVGFGPITFYRYEHRGEERWQNGRFVSLRTDTNDNGRIFQLRAQRGPAGVAIRATDLADQTAPETALPLTHWAQQAMQAPLFNPQTGKILAETARPIGRGTIVLANGKPIAASGYTLEGETPIKDWYDTAGAWAALDAVGKDGSAIAYRRKEAVLF